TVSLERVVTTFRQRDPSLREDLLRHLSPLGREHINLTGDYVWSPGGGTRKGQFRPLRTISSSVTPERAIFPVPRSDPKLVVELLPEFVHSRWTSRGSGANLALSHRGGRLIVPVWDMVSDQDKPPGPQIPLDPEEK